MSPATAINVQIVYTNYAKITWRRIIHGLSIIFCDETVLHGNIQKPAVNNIKQLFYLDELRDYNEVARVWLPKPWARPY